jgi:NitT/TauT family transport system substrate-binding protein
MRQRRWKAMAAISLAIALIAAACGDDDGGTAAPTTTGAPGAPTTTVAAVAGCQNGYTDPASLSTDRKVARCEKGAPAPQPLAQRTRVKVATNFRLEFNSPLLLAQSLGEFEKENIEVEFINLRFSDAVPQLANGSIDAAVGGIEISLFSAGNNNLPVKMVMGNYYPPFAGDYKVAQTGLWCRRDAFSNPQNPDLKETERLKWASSVGKGSVAIYYAVAEMNRRLGAELDIRRTEIMAIPATDQVAALRNNAVQCAILLDPLWTQVSTDPNFFQAATQTPGEPLGLYAFGKSLLQDKPEVGVAFARAFIRTVNTYFSGDYHQDPQVMAEIAKQINRPVEDITKGDYLVMDWEVRKGTTTRVQELFIKLGVITDWQTPVAEEKLVDRSFYMRAVGAQ